MRISDWSSDVCSSDLLRRTLRPRLSGAVAARHAPSAAAPALRRAAGSLIARHEKRAAPVRSGPFSLAPRRDRTPASDDGQPGLEVIARGVGIGADLVRRLDQPFRGGPPPPRPAEFHI